MLTAIASTAIGFIRLVLSNPLYRHINDNDNTFASIIATFLSSSMQLPSSSISYLLAKHKMTINADEYTAKKKSDDGSSSNHENNNNNYNYDGNNNNNNNSNNYSATINSDKKLTKSLLLLSSWSSLVQLAFGNKRYFRIFLIATIAYGILFLQISSILVYRSQSFKYLYGVDNTPSITTITYGPVGYAPALSIYITDHSGLFIFPINLLILIAVSVLVGFNIMFSIFALRVRAAIAAVAFIKGKMTMIANTTSGSERYHTLLKSIAYVAGLFTACPTCASSYILGLIFPSTTTTFGSFTLSIATFTSSYYLAIFCSSIVVLLFSPFITTATIRKYLSFEGSACKLERG